MTHYLELTISHHGNFRDEGIDARFRCDAPVGADCRLTCLADCEAWSLPSDAHVEEMQERVNELTDFEFHDDYPGRTRDDVLAQIERDHRLRDQGECSLVAFIENDESDLAELFAGEGVVDLRSGPVELTYEDEYVSWNYPTPEGVNA